MQRRNKRLNDADDVNVDGSHQVDPSRADMSAKRTAANRSVLGADAFNPPAMFTRGPAD